MRLQLQTLESQTGSTNQQCSWSVLRSGAGSDIKLASRELLVSLQVLLAGLSGHLGGKGRRRGLFVPAYFFQVVANVLLIVRVLSFARLIAIGRPEARGIGS